VRKTQQGSVFALLCLASYAWFHRNGPLKGLRGGTQFVPHLPSGGCTSAHLCRRKAAAFLTATEQVSGVLYKEGYEHYALSSE
jgi:hypothetical protein